MSKLVTWRALQPCVVGGAYREAGEVFEAPDGDYAPDVREKVDGVDFESSPAAETSAKAKSAKSKAAPGVTPAELPNDDV